MIIQQLSVFLENKSGRLNEILDILGHADIRIIAATVADTSEYGILRLITSDTQTAYKLLKENKVSANLSEVIAISCDSLAGDFATKLKCFSEHGINIEYIYCFSVKSKAFLILRANDKDPAIKVSKNFNLTMMSEKQLTDL